MQPREPNPDLERVRFELRATGLKPQTAYNPLRTGIHSRGYLPHVKREGASYFVTFRLADSLPRDVLMKFQQERVQRRQPLQALTEEPAPTSPVESEEEINRDYCPQSGTLSGQGRRRLRPAASRDSRRGGGCPALFPGAALPALCLVVMPTMCMRSSGRCQPLR